MEYVFKSDCSRGYTCVSGKIDWTFLSCIEIQIRYHNRENDVYERGKRLNANDSIFSILLTIFI